MTNFAYDAFVVPYAMDANAGTGELIRVTTPYGGHLRWDYQANTLAGSCAFREVQTRSILLSSTGTETGVSISLSGQVQNDFATFARNAESVAGHGNVQYIDANGQPVAGAPTINAVSGAPVPGLAIVVNDGGAFLQELGNN